MHLTNIGGDNYPASNSSNGLSAEAMLGDLLAIIHGDGGQYQATYGTRRAWEAAVIKAAQGRAALKDAKTESEEGVPHCCVCGTTEGLHKDGWYGWRCNDPGCVCF